MQAFGGVDGDDPNQLGITFQAENVGITLIMACGDGLAEKMNQRLRPLAGGAGALQEFAKLKEIGQAPFSIRVAQQLTGYGKVVDAVMQHGQNALTPPSARQVLKIAPLFFPGIFIPIESVQILMRQVEQRQGQSDAQALGVFRIGNGFQPEQQLLCFGAVIYRLFFREENTAYAPPLQGFADTGRLMTVTHENGDISPAYLSYLLSVFLAKTGFRISKYLDNAFCCLFSGMLQIICFVEGFCGGPDGQGGPGLLAELPIVVFAFGLDGPVGQGIVCTRFSIGKCAFGLFCFGFAIERIERGHQWRAGAEIGVELVVPTCGQASCLQITLDVGAAKTINGLLGVTNEQQEALGGVACRGVNGVENPVLQAGGILKFIDHGHRILILQTAFKSFGPGRITQCVGEATLIIVKADLMMNGFEGFQSLLNPRGGMALNIVMNFLELSFEGLQFVENGFQYPGRRRCCNGSTFVAVFLEAAGAEQLAFVHPGGKALFGTIQPFL